MILLFLKNRVYTNWIESIFLISDLVLSRIDVHARYYNY